MDQWLFSVTSNLAAKRSAKILEVAVGPVHCHFSLPPSFLTMCSSECCLSFVSPWYIGHLKYVELLSAFTVAVSGQGLEASLGKQCHPSIDCSTVHNHYSCVCKISIASYMVQL